MHTLFMPTMINIYNELLNLFKLEPDNKRDFFEKLDDIKKNSNQFNSIHFKIQKLFEDEFIKWNCRINLKIYNSNLRKQGFISLIYHFKTHIFDYTDIKPDWIPHDYVQKIKNGTDDFDFTTNASLKLFYYIAIILVSSKNKEKTIYGLFKPFFKSCEIINKPLIPELIIKSPNMFRLITFNVLTTFQFSKTPDNSYGLEEVVLSARNKKLQKVIEVIFIQKPDIVLLQEIDDKWKTKEIEASINTHGLTNLFEDEHIIQFKKRKPGSDWIEQDDGVSILYSIEKFTCLAIEKGNFIDELGIGNGSAYIFGVFEDNNTHHKLFIINIHIKIDNWEDPSYTITGKILPFIEEFIFKISMNKLNAKDLKITDNDILIFAGDFNSYEFKYIQPIQYDKHIYPIKYFNSWNTKLKINRRDWVGFKAALRDKFNTYSLILQENDIGHVSGIGCTNNGGETDHILTSLNNVRQYYHLETKHLFDILHPGCPKELIECGDKIDIDRIDCLRHKKNQQKNIDLLSTSEAVSDHYPKTVDLYYEHFDDLVLTSDLIKEHFSGYELAVNATKGTIFMIYLMYTTDSNYLFNIISKYLHETTGLAVIHINTDNEIGYKALWDFDEDSNVICILKHPLNTHLGRLKNIKNKNRFTTKLVNKSLFIVGTSKKKKKII